MVAEAPAVPLIEQLDPYRQVSVVMALLAIVLVGLFLVAAVMIGAHWVRRMARHSRGPTRSTGDVANRRLRNALGPILPEGRPEGRSDETTIVKAASDDTVVGQ